MNYYISNRRTTCPNSKCKFPGISDLLGFDLYLFYLNITSCLCIFYIALTLVLIKELDENELILISCQNEKKFMYTIFRFNIIFFVCIYLISFNLHECIYWAYGRYQTFCAFSFYKILLILIESSDNK